MYLPFWFQILGLFMLQDYITDDDQILVETADHIRFLLLCENRWSPLVIPLYKAQLQLRLCLRYPKRQIQVGFFRWSWNSVLLFKTEYLLQSRHQKPLFWCFIKEMESKLDPKPRGGLERDHGIIMNPFDTAFIIKAVFIQCWMQPSFYTVRLSLVLAGLVQVAFRLYSFHLISH